MSGFFRLVIMTQMYTSQQLKETSQTACGRIRLWLNIIQTSYIEISIMKYTKESKHIDS